MLEKEKKKISGHKKVSSSFISMEWTELKRLARNLNVCNMVGWWAGVVSALVICSLFINALLSIRFYTCCSLIAFDVLFF